MKIVRTAAHLLRPPVPVRAPGIDRVTPRTMLLLEIETDSGLIGHGTTGLAPSGALIPLLNNVCAPLIKGLDARRISDVWNVIYREIALRGQTGLVYNAMSAIDIALWDIRGKALGEPIWRLLGGARTKVPCYVTCGLPSFSKDELVAVAKYWVEQEFGGLKIVVGRPSRDLKKNQASVTEVLREDARRIGAVREAVGDSIDIALDINCNLDSQQAMMVTRLCAPYDIAFIEEPILDNHPGRTADFRRHAGVPVASGQSMGGLARFGELLAQNAVDILQPNVINCGGYTGGLRAADLALAHEIPICNGGGSTVHNLHLQAGAINGTACEWHPYQSAGAMAVICPSAPQPEKGHLIVPETPGLGFDPDPDAVREYADTRGAAS